MEEWKYIRGILEGRKTRWQRETYNCNGNKEYEGGWKNDNKYGQGTLYWADGDRYEGGWKGGSKYGQGTHYTKDGHKYTGVWDNNMKGQGEINYKDGKKYTGQWDNWNLTRHGLGTLYSAEGQVLNQGKWERDKYMGKE